MTGESTISLSQKDTLFFRYSADWSALIIPDTFDRNIGGNEASFAGDDDVKGRKLVAAWTRTFSPGTIGDFRYGYTQFNMSLLPTELSNPLWKTNSRTKHERSVSALGAHRGNHRVCGPRQRPFDAADPRPEDARDWLPTSPC